MIIFLLVVHYLIIIFFLSHITLVFLNILYVSILYGHDDVCTCVITIHNVSDGLWWLHTFASSLLLYKFGRTSSFHNGCTWLLSILMLCRFLFLWMNIYVYNFFLPIFSYFVSMLELITSLLDSTLPIFPTICTILGLFFIGYISSEGRNFLSGRKSSK